MSTATATPTQQATAPDYKSEAEKRLGLEKEKKTSQAAQKPELKSFAALDISEFDEPGLNVEKGGKVEAEKALDLISKAKTAGDVLRKSEGREEKKKPVAANPSEADTLGELDALSEKSKPKPEEPGSKEYNFKELRRLKEEAEARAKTAEEAFKPLQERAAQLEAELEKAAFERSPKFREKFLKPKEEADATLRAYAKDIAEDESLADQAMLLAGKARINFIDEKLGGGAASSEFLRLVNEAEGKRTALQTALESHKETATRFQEEQQQEQRKTVEETERNFGTVLERIAPKLSLFRKGTDDDHNAAVETRIAAARAIITGEASEADIMAAPFLAIIAKDTLKENVALKEELRKYKERASQDAEYEARIAASGETDSRKGPEKPVSARNSIASQLPAR